MTTTSTAVVRNIDKDETKQTEIRAHIPVFRESSITVERFPVLYCFTIAHAQTIRCAQMCSDSMQLKKGMFSL